MALINPKQLQSGSYNISGSFSGSFQGDGSGLTNLPSQTINSSSFVTTASFNAFTASINSFTSSYNTGSFTGSFTGSLAGTASYALTASYAMNGGGGGNINTSSLVTTASFNAFTASINSFTASYNTGSFTGSFTGSLFGTSSWASNALTASYVTLAQTASYIITAQTASYVQNAQTASFVTASNVIGTVTSSSYAISASYLIGGITIDTGSLVTTSSFNTFTSSIQGQVNTLTAATSSYTLNSVTASMLAPYVLTSQTASMTVLSASNAVTSSYVTASNVYGPYGSNSIISSSYALTASYAMNGGVTQLLAGPNVILSPTNGLGQVTISSTGGGGSSFNTATSSYGSFYSTQTQTNVAGTARSMSLNITDITNGVFISGSTSPFNTYIKTQNAGIYNIQFSAQVDKTDSGTDEIWIWIRKNGTDLTDTATSIQLVGNGAHYVAAWNFFVNAAADDYFQLMWYSPDANVRLHAEPAFGVVPGIPSLIVTANRIDQFLSNTGSFSGSFTGGFTGSLLGTATTASYVLNAVSSSFASTASYITASNVIGVVTSASSAVTASFLQGLNLGLYTTTASFNTFTASYTTGSFTGSFTGTLTGTASWASNSITSQTASFVTASNVVGTVSSASYALTASYAMNGGGGNINTSSLVTTASFNAFTSSYTTGSFTGSFFGNGSNLEMATSATGVVVSFSASYIYNSSASAGTGPITDNLTGSKLGIVQKIYHSSGSIPTVPAGWAKLGTGTYIPSVLNIIYAEWVSGSRVEYWVVQGS
jgi:hypothetical protein